jgi:hypothetical protein
MYWYFSLFTSSFSLCCWSQEGYKASETIQVCWSKWNCISHS